MSDRKHTYLFNPTQKEAQQLKAEFVVRTAIFDQIFTDIQSDKMQKPPQHYMLLGQRGMGKTTMLLRLKYAIQDDESLNKWLLPIMFNEEQYSMPDLASFFEHIAKLLAEDHPEYDSLLKTMRMHEFEKEYEQKAYDILIEFLKENNQKIIIFHDNFGQFLEKIGKISTHRLRNILMNSSEIRLVGASATLLEHSFNYKEPFFDFFYQIRLKGMTSNETIMLFEKLAENEGKTEKYKSLLDSSRSRIDVIRKLSGGVIRTMVMLFDVFIDNEKQDSFKDLEAILDRVTPLYKHRMDDLKPQQQLIVDAVAKAWDAVTVSEIAVIARADRQGLKTNQISAQLKQLVDNQIIEIEPRTIGRTNLYRLQERFFNIWYLMRYSTRQDKQRVIWFVKFLEDWCDTSDLKQLFDRFDNNLEIGTYELSTVFDRALAYSMVKSDDLLLEKARVLENAIKHLILKKDNQINIKFLNNRLSDLEFESKLKSYNAFLNLLKLEIELLEYISVIENNNFLKKITLLINFSYKNLKENKVIPSNENIDELIFEIVLNESILGIFIPKSNVGKKINTFIEVINLTNLNSILKHRILMQDLILILIWKKQYHTVLNIFDLNKSQTNLIELFRPLYFLTMEYLKDEYPNEYLKAGEEYRETIEELKERVKWFDEKLG